MKRLMIALGAFALLTAPAPLLARAAASNATPPAPVATTLIKAYKRDPVPIYDNSGSKLRDIAQSAMPKPNSAAAAVIAAKPGFVAIRIDGQPSWLRLTSVDYVGDLPVPQCGKTNVQLALMEEDGVERSLGLGCAKLAAPEK